MAAIMLCPNCRTIQKEGSICPLCGCPVSKEHPTREWAKDSDYIQWLQEMLQNSE